MLTPVNTVRKSFKRPNLGEGCGSGTSAPDSSVLQERDLCFVTARLMAGDGGGADVVAAVALAAGDGDKSSLVPTFWSWKHLDPMIDLPLCKKAGLKLDQNNSEMRQAESNPACVALARQRDNVSSGGLVILPFRPCGCEGRTTVSECEDGTAHLTQAHWSVALLALYFALPESRTALPLSSLLAPCSCLVNVMRVVHSAISGVVCVVLCGTRNVKCRCTEIIT